MKNYKIGYATGVFDLFHVGHLNIIKRAKEQCEYLIVGVSTDEVVESYKNKRPIIPFEERIAIVEAIKYVDRAIPQLSMNKLDAWKELRFDAFFHGDDLKNSALYKQTEADFEKCGITMVYLPYTQGTSSTKLSDVLEQVMKQHRNI